MTKSHRFVRCLAIALAMHVGAAAPTLAADVYKATAKFTSADGERVAIPVTISLDQPTTEAERTALLDKVRTDAGAIKAALAAQRPIGYIEARDRRVPIKYAYARPAGNGTMLTVISDEALGYVGSEKKYPKAKEGYDLTYAMLATDGAGNGRGEMAPACKVKFMESGAPAVEDYGAQVVWLDDATKAAQP
jgi:hypothetical protein